MTKICTSLNKIRACHPCQDGWSKLLAHLGKTKADDEPLAFSKILESNGLDDALWALRSAPEFSNQWRLMAVRFAREVQYLMKDARPIEVLDVAEAHARGEASDEDLVVARKASWATAWVVARTASEAAARAAAEDAAGEIAWDAAWVAAGDAAAAAAVRAAGLDTAEHADRVAARDAAFDRALIKQSEIFLEFVK
jgi:hypothetical protein